MTLLRWQHDIGAVIGGQVWDPRGLRQWTTPDLAFISEEPFSPLLFGWCKTSTHVRQIGRALSVGSESINASRGFSAVHPPFFSYYVGFVS